MKQKPLFRLRKRDRSPGCCVVDQFCTRAADEPGIDDMPPLVTGCLKCGQSVCGRCSSIRRWRSAGRTLVCRLCNNCQIEIDGDDRFVMARIRSQAGYPYLRPSRVQAAEERP